MSAPIIHKIKGLGHRQIYLIMSLADEEDASETRDICLIDSSAHGWAIDVSRIGRSATRAIEGDARSLGNLASQLYDITGHEHARASGLADRIAYEVIEMLYLLASFGCATEALEDLRAFGAKSWRHHERP